MELKQNSFQAVKSKKLKAFLEQNRDQTSLRDVDLSHHQITDEDAEHLVRLLKKNPGIDCLDLTSNPLTDKGVVLFAQLPLKELHLVNNKTTCEALEPFCKSQSLLYLSYYRDRSHPRFAEISEALSERLEHNRLVFRKNLVLTYIALTQNYLKKENHFNRLPKPIFFHILGMVGDSYQYAFGYSQHYFPYIQKCANFIIESLKRDEKNTLCFFKEACSLLPLGGGKPEGDVKIDAKGAGKSRCIIS